MTTRLRALITDLAYDAGIDVIQVEGRAKAVDSFVEKIGRKGKKYENPFTDMTDLIGLRIIIYYGEDVARIGEILKGEFKVDEKNSVDKIAGLAADRFGYRSVHYIVWLSPAGGQLAELRDARARIEAEYAADVRGGHRDLPLDEASLTAYLDDSGESDIIGKMITDTGGKLYGQDERVLAKDRRDLLKLLNITLAENILPVPVSGTDLFRKVGLESVEDALTMLIMVDQRVSHEIFSMIYLPDGGADFARLMEKWQSIRSAAIQ